MMQWLLTGLAWIGWGLLALLGLLLLVLICPSIFRIRYERNVFSLEYRLLFFWIRIFPQKEKKKKPPKETPQSAEKPQKKSAKRKLPDFRVIADALPMLLQCLKRILRCFLIYDMRFRLIVGGDDPADIARMTGRLRTAVPNLLLLSSEVLRLSVKSYRIDPNYLEEEGLMHAFTANIRVVPVVVLYIGAICLIRILRSGLLRQLLPQKAKRSKGE